MVATNVAGASPAGMSPAATTEKEPPAQTSPAPISTSRYIRNITRRLERPTCATMRAEGAADATANPSGHGYLVLLDIGGQDESRHGVVLSAGIRFVSYADMVKNLKAYVDGYASQQRPSAPVTIAIATNNDIDVSRSSGASFANKVIDPVRRPRRALPGHHHRRLERHGARLPRRATGDQVLARRATSRATHGAVRVHRLGRRLRLDAHQRRLQQRLDDARHVPPRRRRRTRSASSTCRRSTTRRWPQQWQYISLTGVQAGHPRINFGGALTE